MGEAEDIIRRRLQRDQSVDQQRGAVRQQAESAARRSLRPQIDSEALGAIQRLAAQGYPGGRLVKAHRRRVNRGLFRQTTYSVDEEVAAWELTTTFARTSGSFGNSQDAPPATTTVKVFLLSDGTIGGSPTDRGYDYVTLFDDSIPMTAQDMRHAVAALQKLGR